MAALTLPLFDEEPVAEPLHPAVRTMLEATGRTEAEVLLLSLRGQLDAGQEKLGKALKPKKESWADTDIDKVIATVKRLKSKESLLVDIMVDTLRAYSDAKRIFDQRVGDWYFEEFTRRHNPDVATEHVAEIKVDRPWVEIEPGQRVSWLEGKKRYVGVVERHTSVAIPDPRYPVGHIEHIKYPSSVLVITDLGYSEQVPISRTDNYFYTQLYLVYGGEQPPVNRQKPVEVKLVRDSDWSKLADQYLIAQIKHDLILIERPDDMTWAWDAYVKMRDRAPTVTADNFRAAMIDMELLPLNFRRTRSAYFQPTHKLKSDGSPVRVIERCDGSLEWIAARDENAAVGRVAEDDKEEFYSTLDAL